MSVRTCLLAFGILAAAACGGPQDKRGPSPGGLDRALDAFQAGDPDAADALLRADGSPDAELLRGRLLLLRNRNREAARVLAPLAPPPDRKAKTFAEYEIRGLAHRYLATACLRTDDFSNAAKYFAYSGEQLLARKYQILTRDVGYLMDSRWKEARIPLLATRPVPVVGMRVNGQRALFIVDTGANEIILDRKFANRVGAKGFGVRREGFQRSYDEGIVGEIGLGNLHVKNVPVHIGQLAPIAAVKAAGAIGLGFLMRFDFTIDFRRSQLVLRRPGEKTQGLPALRGGDNHLLVPGKLNGRFPTHVAVQTGLAGITVAASANFLQVTGQKVQVLEVGPLKLQNPPADINAFPTGLEASFAVPVGFVLGPGALRNRSLRLDPRSMSLLIE